ncbi:MAG: glycosyltransferase family 1 protein [Anaerolineaceae bacterium]|nr:glycosyltransferase family 1 protein [Anaerolineaceae bacterium]
MRVAIDASRATVARATGTEHYSRELIRALLRLGPEHEYHLFFRDDPPAGLFSGRHVVQHVIPLPRLWTHLRLAAALYALRPDVSFVPAHSLPLFLPGPALVTVHDLGFHHFPDAHPPRARRYLAWSTRHSAQRASLVLADSQATADDLCDFCEIAPEKIRVVYPGLTPLPIGDASALRRKYDLPPRYYLFLGTLQPRKNLPTIVAAWQRWRTTNPDDDAALVLAGGRGWLLDNREFAGLEDVYLPGYIDDEDRGALYAGARALLFPSLHEGFGFPVLEAMHCGTPVITSVTSSLPELAGDAALLVEPGDVKGIARQMTRLQKDRALRNRLVRSGQARAARFSWERAARATLLALQDAAGAT